MTRIAVTGGRGAMGRTVRAVADEREDVTVELVVTRSPDALVDGSRTVTPSALDAAIGDVDALVDFTVPEAAVDAVETAASAGIPAVVGTTGFTDDQLAALRAAEEAIPVLVAPNFSRGMYALRRALAATVERLPGYDIELTETHHARKRDAPSGTATALLATIEDVRTDTHPVHGRVGEHHRGDSEIGVHTRRAGSITGEHEVLLAGQDEEVRLVHRAESRAVFAAGAVDAAVWLADRPAGWYRFGDVIEA